MNKIKHLKKNVENYSSNYDKSPFIKLDEKTDAAVSGWLEITKSLKTQIEDLKKPDAVIVIDYYPGVNEDELFHHLILPLYITNTFNANDLFKTETEIKQLTYSDVTDDPVFGHITRLSLYDFFDENQFINTKRDLDSTKGLR
ncbi:MAG: hypothetical protein ABIN04_05515 [Ginsengibacter sp.]